MAGIKPVVAKTVIIADDTAYVRDRFAAALSDAGHRPILAGTVPELFACLRGAGPRLDLLVIDLQLPGGKGMDLLKTIRDGGCQAPMLIFSGTIPHARNVRELAPYRVSGFINE